MDAADDKRSRILDAALEKFAAYGVARTSMADIAASAGMSRPAVYQHFASKDEIFAAMLGRVLTSAAERAIAELERPGDLAAQLDGFLQRWHGDLAEQMTKTTHGADLIEAKAGLAKPVVDATNARIRKALVERLAAAGATDARELADLLVLAPIGLKYDGPSIAVLRRRLSTLARSVHPG